MEVLEQRTVSSPVWFVWMRQLRVHQWVKNILVFVPLLAAHKFNSPATWWATAQAFLAFSFLASAVYLLNDFLDLQSDRQHATKKNRPLASGAISSTQAWALLALLAVSCALLTLRLPAQTALLFGIYLLSNCAYSLALKKVPIVDVVLLATFYGLRILVGGAATGIEVSNWLLAFSNFFFFSLALIKRCTEIGRTEGAVSGRGYKPSDGTLLYQLGTASSLLSVLILVLYLNSPKVAELYSEPGLLWLVVPALLFWVSRIWFLTSRDELHDDPVVFAVKDPVTWGVGAFLGILLWLSI